MRTTVSNFSIYGVSLVGWDRGESGIPAGFAKFASTRRKAGLSLVGRRLRSACSLDAGPKRMGGARKHRDPSLRSG